MLFKNTLFQVLFQTGVRASAMNKKRLFVYERILFGENQFEKSDGYDLYFIYLIFLSLQFLARHWYTK